MTRPTPIEITLRQNTRRLDVHFDDGYQCSLPCEYLRVYSPSAEVQGHGPNNAKLVTGKADVQIIAIEPVGHYALRLVFDDGHNSGLYTFEKLYELGQHQTEYWSDYLRKLADVTG